jgi:hypothetical protein
MAVLESLPGLTVSIHVDGQPLPEYEDHTEEETPDGPVAEYQAARTVCRYVEALSDKDFCIKTSLDAPYIMDCPSLMFPCWVDGNPAPAKVLKKTHHLDRIQGDLVVYPLQMMVEGVTVEAPGRSDQEFLKKFRFAKIEMCMFFVKTTWCFLIS